MADWMTPELYAEILLMNNFRTIDASEIVANNPKEEIEKLIWQWENKFKGMQIAIDLIKKAQANPK